MNVITFFQQYISSKQEFHLRIQRWKRRLSLLLAFIVPGFPQITDRKRNRLLTGSFLFFLGTGALITMAIGIYLSRGDIRTFDPSYYAIGLPKIFSVFPHSTSFADPSDKLIPIYPPEEPRLIQLFFWELLYAYIFLYVVCGIISFWEQWKSGNKIIAK